MALKYLARSEVLTGTVGRDPGYDPLAFMLQEAHRRGINVHAAESLSGFYEYPSTND